MEITYVGPWVLLCVGGLLTVAAIYVAVVQRRQPILLLIFGFLFAGVGIHGPLFMGPYAKLLRAPAADE